MLFTSVRRLQLQFFAFVTALPLCACASAGALDKTSLRIEMVRRNSGGPVEVNPVTEHRVLYLQGDRRRIDWRRASRDQLWPGGPRVTFFEPHTALIETCEGGANEAFSLNLDDRTYAPFGMMGKLTTGEMKSLQSQVPNPETPLKPTVLHEITTVDRGERKRAFNYTARHVITTFKVTPLEGARVMPQESITDGWYIDLKTRISCDRPEYAPSEGTTYAAVRLMGTATSLNPGERTPWISASPTSLVKTTYVGKPETGFPIWVKTTTRSVLAQGRRTKQVTTSETEVSELSWRNLDAELFKAPKNFRSVERILPWPRAALWAQWLAWMHNSWMRFRQMTWRSQPPQP